MKLLQSMIEQLNRLKKIHSQFECCRPKVINSERHTDPLALIDELTRMDKPMQPPKVLFSNRQNQNPTFLEQLELEGPK